MALQPPPCALLRLHPLPGRGGQRARCRGRRRDGEGGGGGGIGGGVFELDRIPADRQLSPVAR
eukprot:4936301-Pyramimonas_sp.AAC.1